MRTPVLVVSFALVAAVSLLVGLLAGSPVSAPHVSAAQGTPSFADIVARVNPAVVNITVTEGAQADEGPGERPAGWVRRGEGTGFVVDAQGFILTNHHVVASTERIRVRMSDKREFPAVLVGSDASTDLALLKVDAVGLPTVPLGDSDRLRVGEWVFAIGNPYRFDHSVTVGVVSSKGRKIYDASFDAYIQTDAAINPGNSGGPLINALGEAIGINSAMSIQGQGIGFAIPINMAREVLEQLRARGHVTRGFLGVTLQELDPDLQRLVGMREGRGAMVLEVMEGGAGEAAGLKRYDVITSVGGQDVSDGDQLVRAISLKPPGSQVDLSVFRDGRQVKLQARLAERAVPSRASLRGLETEDMPPGDVLGLVVAPLTPETQSEMSIPPERAGVVVRDVVGLASGLEQIANGDLILEVNRRPTPDVDAYRRVLAGLRPREPAWLFVFRGRPGTHFLAKVDVERQH
ncbi:MAG TPA: trypsin-like peptidase domain-containing protein [Vicinamibacteria bacterium]|nr:trypsin-like peptidase domain-containing protein [Vicinamibacteria bacterium]